MTDESFEYDTEKSFDDNYSKWYRMNCAERKGYNEEILPEQVAKRMFNENYGSFINKLKKPFGGYDE